MRELTKSQKAILDKWFSKNKEVVERHWDIVRQPEFDILEKLEAINNSEVLYVQINQYLNDKGLE